MNYSFQYRKRLKRISFVFLFLVFIQSNALIIQSDLTLVISPADSSFTKQASNTTQMWLPEVDNLYVGFIEWLPEEVLEENTGFIRDLKIAIDGFNNTHVFWVQIIDSNWQLLEKIKFAVNSTWNEHQVLSYLTDSNEIWMFDVATSNDGKIHLTWENNGQIFYRYYVNPTWSSVSFIAYGKKPKIEISISNNPGVIFTQSVNIEYTYYMSHKFAVYSATDDLWEYTEFGLYWEGRDSNHDFTTNIQNGKEYFQGIVCHLRKTWNREESRYYTNFTLDSVSKANDSEILQTITIEDDPLLERPFYWNSEPIILSDKENKMHVIVDYWGLNGQEIFCYQYNGGNWGSRIKLSTTASPDVSVVHKTAAIDPSGGVTSVWTERRFINSSIETGMLQIKSYKPTSGWSETAYLQTNLTYSRSPYLEFDAAGDAHLVWWEDFEGERTLHYRFGYGDGDGDGLSNKDEKIYGTDPDDPDTDDDQMLDGEEIANGFDPLNPDEDTDGMLDGYEFHYGLDPYSDDSLGDLDNDSLLNIEEFLANTYPNDNDSDDDFVSDYEEVVIYLSNPLNTDTDGDTLDDGLEINDLSSDPNSGDSDNDTMSDAYEYLYRDYLDINVNDSALDPDGEGLINLYEYQWNLHPGQVDYEGDGLDDYQEVMVWGTNPVLFDTDKDGYMDGVEVYGIYAPTNPAANATGYVFTNPTLWDTDGDLLSDKTDITINCNPLDNDTDDDLMSDGYEYYMQLDPLNASDATLDLDGDTLTNYEEFLLWTDPKNTDTDGDKLWDNEELVYGSDPTFYDTDGDGLNDYVEIIVLLTNVTNPDTDLDGLLDGLEVHTYYSNPHIQDTDGDTIIDGDEVYIYNTNPTTIHSDDDLLADNLEIIFGTNPNQKDTDIDGMDDFWEWQYGLNGTINDSNLDFDNDNVINIVEYNKGSNPLLAESDDDGIIDYDEIYIYFTHPGMNDTDEDGLSDYEELFVYLTIPYDADTDDDGLWDGYEIEIGTDPLHVDTDRDGVSDEQELEEGTDPLEPNSNRLRITLITFLIVSNIVLGSLTLYYGVPWVISKRKKNIELLWMKQGLETKERESKNEEMTKNS